MKRALPFILAVAWVAVCAYLAIKRTHEAQAIVDRQQARIEQLQTRNGELYHKLRQCEGPEITPSAFVPQCLPNEDGSVCQARIGDTGRYEVVEMHDGTLRVDVKP